MAFQQHTKGFSHFGSQRYRLVLSKEEPLPGVVAKGAKTIYRLGRLFHGDQTLAPRIAVDRGACNILPL
jgi:hypothetical protein